LFVLPSLLILIALSWVYLAFGDVPWVAGLFFGIKPAVTAIVVQAAHRIGSRALKNKVLWAMAAASFVAIFAFDVPFPLIVGMAAAVGYIGGRISPHAFQTGGGHGASHASYGPALIDDHTPPPTHARFSFSGLTHVLLTGAALWALPMGVLYAVYGWDHSFTQMAWFFTKAALLTFGGAYAVLPYVYQGAVGHYGWVTPTQMMDGLALGETTPGPLIMVVAFVGFIGGYVKALLGPESLFAAGALAACLVTWFTFLPSFIFILAGGPLVESTHRNLQFTAPLTAITAAVVGVVINLALFFGYHLLWPEGLDGALDVRSALIAIGAAVMLFKYKRSVIETIGLCALVGLAVKLIPL
jgi:chromate transporter